MHGQAVIVEQPILEGAAIRAISWLKPEDSWDSGYALFSSTPNETTDSKLACLHCVVDENPELAHGLKNAREHGEWIA